MLGEEGTQQFAILTRVDGKVVGNQPIHDPFIHNKTVVGISRWALLKALFKKQFTVTVEVAVSGSEGVTRAVMSLDPVAIESDSRRILAERSDSRFSMSGHCYQVGR